MKLHHFITAVTDPERVQQLGKAMAPAQRPTTISIPVSAPSPVVEEYDEASGDDLTQQIRDYAISQMEKSTHSSHLHRKIRHYD